LFCASMQRQEEMTLMPKGQTNRIVLIEDNPADVYLFRQALQNAGLNFELTLIQDGEAALAFAQSHPNYSAIGTPDLLVLDLNLPKIGGLEILEVVRRNPNLAHVPVAVMTSSAASQDHERCSDLGVNRYIVKPLELEEFLKIGEIVKTLLGETGM